MPEGKDPESHINRPQDARYYDATGGVYEGRKNLLRWIGECHHEEKKKQGRGGLSENEEDLKEFIDLYSKMDATANGDAAKKKASVTASGENKLSRVVVGCDFGSAPAKAVCGSPER